MKTDYVWYACYGSNLNRKRFGLYIQGGYSKYGKYHHGCSLKDEPAKEKNFIIPYELYFAKKSESWKNKGVAFIKNSRDKNARTCSRLYLIKEEQFKDIFLQENGKDPLKDKSYVDLNRARKNGFCLVGNKDEYTWYGRLLYLGEEEGHPIYSFTAKWEYQEIECNKPCEKYLNTIITGIKEIFEMRDLEIYQYFVNLCGIKGEFTKKELLRIINLRSKEDKQFIVRPTKFRGKVKGELITLLNSSVLKEMNLNKGEYVNVKNNLYNRDLIITALIKTDDNLKNDEIRVDQKIRNAIGVKASKESGGKPIINTTVTIEKLQNYFFRKKSLFSRCMGVQKNICRVKFATFSDMEINLCRIRKAVMKTIGVDEGDAIIVASSTNKIAIRVFELTPEMEKKRRETENKKDSIYYRDHEIREKLENAVGHIYDLPWIFLDLDARKRLNIRPSDPVKIYRSIRYTIISKLHLMSIPLILTIIGFVIALEPLKNNITLQIILFSFGLVMVFLLNLLTLKLKT